MALLVSPPLELRSVFQEEPIEKRATINRNRRLKRAAVQGVLELVNIGADCRRVEPQRFAAEKYLTPREPASPIPSSPLSR